MILDLLKTREDLGRRNRRLVLAEILFRGPIPRAKIAERVGLTQASVSRISRDLIDAGLIEEGETIDDGRRGRRFIGLKIRPTGCFVAAMTINVFRQEVAIGDMANALLASQRLHFDRLDDAHHVLMTTATALQQLITDTGIDRDRLIGCGVTITGAVDPQRGLLRSSPVLGWQSIEVKNLLEPQLELPVYIDSIPNAKNLAAHGFGPTKEIDDVVLLNASLAIGCSLMLDGRLLRGRQFNAGLIESLPIPLESDSELKPLDDAAGGFAVVEALTGAPTNDSLIAAAKLVTIMADAANGDATAITALNTAGRSLGFAIATVNALLHPEIFLLSGPLVESEAYCMGVRQRLIEIIDAEFVHKRLRYSPMSNQESARSLVIYQSLAHDYLEPVLKMPSRHF